MDVGYVLLGKSRLVDDNMFCDDQSNMYQFNYEGMKINFFSSKPKPMPILQKPNTRNKSSKVSMICAKDLLQEMEKEAFAWAPMPGKNLMIS